MKRLKWTLIALLVVVLTTAYKGLASATLIADVAVDPVGLVGPAPYTYSYTVTNKASSTENIYSFSIFVGVLIFDEDAPVGWVAMIAGDYLSFSTDLPFDITPGSSLAGFEFKSTWGPGIVTYEAGGSNPASGDPTGNFYSSTTTGPVVPEPGTFLLLGVGLAGLAGYIRFRKKSK